MPLSGFHPAVARWFEARFREPTEPQRRAWPVIQAGRNALIAAPTGSGKTFADFLAAIASLLRQGLDGTLRDETQVVYVSPLKALSNDVQKNLSEPLAEIRRTLEAMCLPDVEIRPLVRTGDTPAADRQRMVRRPPHILVTTPESLYLVLTSEHARDMLRSVRTVIVDEIHAVARDKRGSHLALSLERLEHLAGRRLQRIGLSATQKPIEDIAQFLVGAHRAPAPESRAPTIIDSGHARALDLAIEIPSSPLEAVLAGAGWDELVECAALVRATAARQLDRLIIPDHPLDILAQQIVAAAAGDEWDEEALYELLHGAYPYRELTRQDFDAVVQMLAEGFTTRRGRRGAYLHYDGVNRRLRARRGARLAALTSGGAIPDIGDYRVILDPTETFVGTVNEDFAIESMPGDIFQLGNTSYLISKVESGQVRVVDAQGQPPSIPFWLGEAPARTPELSEEVSRLRQDVADRLGDLPGTIAWLVGAVPGLPEPAARQMVEYLDAGKKSLGVIPTQHTLVLERFFDEAGGMQLVQQTIADCLLEAMDFPGLKRVLEAMEAGRCTLIARDTPEPSPLSHEVLNAKPYAFLDDAPLEERRTQAVITRRGLDVKTADDLGKLDQDAIDRVREEAWPEVTSADELHDALLVMGAVPIGDCGLRNADWQGHFEELAGQRRAGRLLTERPLWIAAERVPMLEAVFSGVACEPPLAPPERERAKSWTREDALRELVRGRLETVGPTTTSALACDLRVPVPDVEFAPRALEHEGFVLRGRFTPGVAVVEWCERRLLARIHRYTLDRLRKAIEPVTAADCMRFPSRLPRLAQH